MISSHLTTDELVIQLTLENAELKRQLETEQAERQKWFDYADLVDRVVHNGNMSPAYRLLYISFINTYPQVFTGERIEVELHTVRENAGWISKNSAGNFFQDMQAIEVWEYEPGNYNKKSNSRPGYIKAKVELLPYPEDFNTKNTEARRKAREREAKKLKEYQEALKIVQCEMCSSTDLVYEAVAVCQSCHHRHDAITDIPSANIHIDPEIHEEEEKEEQEEDFIDQAPARRPAPIVTTVPLNFTTHDPATLSLPDKPCRFCGRRRRDCYVPVADAPGIWTFSCKGN